MSEEIHATRQDDGLHCSVDAFPRTVDQTCRLLLRELEERSDTEIAAGDRVRYALALAALEGRVTL